MTGGVEGGADRADLAVHHAARADHVDARLGLGHAHLRVAAQRRVVVDRGRQRVQDAAVPVIGELVEAEVGHHHEGVADLGEHVADSRVEDAVRVGAPEPTASFCSGTPKSMMPPTPRAAASAAALRRVSRVCWTTPGIAQIGRLGRALPDEHRQHELGGVELVSATSRRIAGVVAAAAAGSREPHRPLLSSSPSNPGRHTLRS